VKITQLTAFQFDAPVVEAEDARISGGRTFSGITTTIVKLDTDEGSIGWGESAPYGPQYLPYIAGAILPGLDLVVPKLLGRNPLAIQQINETMDETLYGHPHVKTAIDMACWDLLGKHARLPLYELLGGKLSPAPEVQGFIPRTPGDTLLEALARHRRNGVHHFSSKASGDLETDIGYLHYVGAQMRTGESLSIDVNRGYRLDEALRVVRMAGDIDLMLEQPCATIEECRDLRSRAGVPIMLDEEINTVHDLTKAYHIGAIDALNLKTGRVGGITKARLIRDVCASLRIPMYIQDTAGTSIVEAGIAHVAHSTPPRALLATWDVVGMIPLKTAEGRPAYKDGRIYASDRPGLGVTPLPEVLGEPVAAWD
jgi:L-alanine-DL-glutamate epimerase-like enolase superfamily enzyme